MYLGQEKSFMFLRFKLAKSRGLQCYNDKLVQIRIETLDYIYYWQGNVNVVRRELCCKGILKYHLLNCKCHYFFYECMGLKKTTLSLLKGVTFSLVCVWVKSNWLNVTKYEVFIFWRHPLVSSGPDKLESLHPTGCPSHIELRKSAVVSLFWDF